MTTIAAFTTPEDAHLFRMWLESQGIEAFVFDEYFVQLLWYYSNTIGGVRVEVDDADAEVAFCAYKTYMTALRTGPYPLNPVRVWPIVLLLSLLVGAPFMLFGRHAHRGSAKMNYIMNPYESPTASSGDVLPQCDHCRKGFGMFRYRLARLPFIVLLIIHHSLAAWMLEGDFHYKYALVALSMPLLLLFVVLPRVRDCDWPWWVALTTIIPYLGTITGFGLCFVRTKVFLRNYDSDVSELIEEYTNDRGIPQP